MNKHKNINEEIRIHEDQSDIYSFLKTPNEFCLGCRHVADNKCSNLASEYHGIDVRDEDSVQSKCIDKFSEIDSENFNTSDEETGSLI